jgi:hypothetical protein
MLMRTSSGRVLMRSAPPQFSVRAAGAQERKEVVDTCGSGSKVPLIGGSVLPSMSPVRSDSPATPGLRRRWRRRGGGRFDVGGRSWVV